MRRNACQRTVRKTPHRLPDLIRRLLVVAWPGTGHGNRDIFRAQLPAASALKHSRPHRACADVDAHGTAHWFVEMVWNAFVGPSLNSGLGQLLVCCPVCGRDLNCMSRGVYFVCEWTAD